MRLYNEKFSLQMAIKAAFGEYLKKEMTIAEWGCGVNFNLGTYISHDVVGYERARRIRHEKEFRICLEEYAINDCFSVTRLADQMNYFNSDTPPTTIEHVEEANADDLSVHVRYEPILELQPADDDDDDDSLAVHVQYEPLAPQNTQLELENVSGDDSQVQDERVMQVDNPPMYERTDIGG